MNHKQLIDGIAETIEGIKNKSIPLDTANALARQRATLNQANRNQQLELKRTHNATPVEFYYDETRS